MSSYIRKETLKLAPDAIIFIQGKEAAVLCNSCNRESKMSNDVTNFSVQLPIEGVSGATINLATPIHDPNRWWTNGQAKVKLLSEVEIYVRGRFFIQGTQEPAYYPVFWGIVTQVSRSYSAGKNGVTVSCSGMLRWWEMSHMNVNPSLFDSSTFPGLTPQLYSNIFATLNPLEIAYVLSKLTTGGLLGPQGLNAQFIQDRKLSQSLQALDIEVRDYWQARFDRIGKALRVVGPTGEMFDATKIEEDIQNYFSNQRKSGGDITKAAGGAFFDSARINRLSNAIKPRYRPNALDQTELVENYLPYAELSQPLPFQSTIKSKLEIMNEVRNNIHYEFFQDSTGEIVFKPPFYNMNTKEYPPFVIRDIDIIDASFDEDESAVTTRIDVQGSWLQNLAKSMGVNGEATPRAFHVDPQLLKDYGLRSKSVTNPSLATPEACYLYAVGEMDRMNAFARGGSLTIMGRPELRLGYPVFIEKENAYYYVNHISHNFSYGGTFVTSVGLTAARRQIFEEQTGKPKRFHVFKGTGALVSSNASKPAEEIVKLGQVSAPGEDIYSKHVEEDQQSRSLSRTAPVKGVMRGFAGTFAPTSVTDFDVIEMDYTTRGDYQVPGDPRELRFPYTDRDGYEVVGAYQYGRLVKVDNDGNLVKITNSGAPTGVSAATGSVLATAGGNSSSEARRRIIQDSLEPFSEVESALEGALSLPSWTLEAGYSGLEVSSQEGSFLAATKMSPDDEKSEVCSCDEQDSRDRYTINQEAIEREYLNPTRMPSSDAPNVSKTQTTFQKNDPDPDAFDDVRSTDEEVFGDLPDFDL